jgi:hypothetical protein
VARDRAKVNLDHFVRQYRANWANIESLVTLLHYVFHSEKDKLEKLKGLQKLEDGDVRLLSDWVDEPIDYLPNRREAMPWIWKTGRYELASANGTSSVVEQWEEEGEQQGVQAPDKALTMHFTA